MSLLTSLFLTWYRKKMYLASLEYCSSTLPMRSSTSDQDKSTSNFQDKRYGAISIVIQLMNNQRRSIPREDIDHPKSQRMKKEKLRIMNLLCQNQVHKPSKSRRKKWHHHLSHHHKRCNHQSLHLGTNGCTQRITKTGGVLFGGLKTPNPRWEVKLVAIHIYFSHCMNYFFSIFTFLHLQCI